MTEKINAEANRAARGLLGWSLTDQAAATGVTFETLSRFENGRAMRASNALKLVKAFADHGVEIVADEDRTGALLFFARRPAADGDK